MSETQNPVPRPNDQRAVGAVIVLAAGGGTRMKSSRSKLLHEVCGHSMLSYAVNAATALEPEHLVVVVGHLREQVAEHLHEIAPHCRTAVQDDQNGTGHAVQCGLVDLGQVSGEVVVTYGDVPMLSGETLAELVASHRASEDAITVLTAEVEDPTGYGRIVRDDDGLVARIVEHKDADEATRQITEINSGIYVFDADVLQDGLGRISTDNEQNELYLTDVLGIARSGGRRVGAYQIVDHWQTEGVNDRVQLAKMNREMNRRICEKWMQAGVTIVDSEHTWIHESVDLAPDVTILPGTSLEGATSVASGATIGPDTTLVDVEVGPGATVIRTHGSLAVIGENATVGPFAYLRPGTVLGANGKIGAFVETKNARIGTGAKVPHLSYAGDAIIDADANIGAGTIFANFDGNNKWHTHVGKGAFIGSNSVLVAPVDIGDGGYVAAGSTVTEDVDPGTLAVARGRQKNSTGWVTRRKPGSKADLAAGAAQDYHPHDDVAADRAKQKGDPQ
ncbi:bifunctional UDP-N-acetylglucosamine diphosphorylase/glucosamine-1-phosphate N-acetyltransferase GlmU [Granulicoccus sp. GXG6511]|uniref:bifunctional UDP-N-acetylglucosamine diphosphorylase/glucosamine-1-phosphate N-acetyltransferase GlmU n=1 Tax=Granulicoccus sp. GXG6511 TaxID=3381351 RepID=UPI003D7ED712